MNRASDRGGTVSPGRYTVTRPTGKPWTRTFASAAAAWRVVVGGRGSSSEWRLAKAEKAAEGWRVTMARQIASEPDGAVVVDAGSVRAMSEMARRRG